MKDKRKDKGKIQDMTHELAYIHVRMLDEFKKCLTAAYGAKVVASLSNDEVKKLDELYIPMSSIEEWREDEEDPISDEDYEKEQKELNQMRIDLVPTFLKLMQTSDSMLEFEINDLDDLNNIDLSQLLLACFRLHVKEQKEEDEKEEQSEE